jgi:hypothetical protein
MREVILNYWNWFADLVNPYHDVINTISAIVIAAFTMVLARVARKQTRDARILQRAYLNVKFDGIQSNSAGELVGHVTFQNVGHLPARKLYWLVKLSRGGSDWRPPKIKSKEFEGESVLPLGAEWPQESKGLPNPQDRGLHQDETGLYLYVWGRVTYKDGFRWPKRKTDFCHCYLWQMRTELSDGGVKVGAEYARYHRYGNRAT